MLQVMTAWFNYIPQGLLLQEERRSKAFFCGELLYLVVLQNIVQGSGSCTLILGIVKRS